MPRVWASTGWQGVSIVLYDLVEGLSGANITQASVSSLKAKVFNDASGEQVGSTITLSITDCIFDSLQDTSDDGRYDGDGGFNFRATIPGSLFTSGTDDALFKIFIYFLDQSTPPNLSVVAWQITAKEVLGLPV